MTTYLAFLRAINLGAKRKFPKDLVASSTESAGFAGVQTHLNTGNVRFDTPMRSRSRIESGLETAYQAAVGFEVPTVVFSAWEFAQVAAEARALAEARPDLERHYVYLLKAELSPEQVAQVEERRSEAGEMVVRGRAVHALLGPGYQDGVVDPLGAARLLGVATNRNARVISTLAQKWC